MPKAVQLSAYGGLDQLRIIDVAKPEPKAGEVVVRVVAAGTNPGEISIREGYLKDMFPMDFPFGEGADFAGRVDAVGAGVTEFAPGDEVMGWSDTRSAQADYVAIPASQLIPKPPSLDWFRAGSLFVVATTAVAAVRAVSLKPGDVVAISGAAGGVGSLAVQLARRTGARVIGIASDESAPFLRSVGVEPIAYGDGLAERLKTAAPNGLSAFIDLFGGGYVEPRRHPRRRTRTHQHHHRLPRGAEIRRQDGRLGRCRLARNPRVRCEPDRVGRDRHALNRNLSLRNGARRLRRTRPPQSPRQNRARIGPRNRQANPHPTPMSS